MIFQNKIAVITGGTKGIGRAVAEALLREGANVFICARDKFELKRALEELSKLGKIEGEICDVRSASQVKVMLDECVRLFGGVDILVNNAGVGLFGKTVEEIDEVLLAITALGLSTELSSVKTDDFISARSIIASITRSADAKSFRLEPFRSLAKVAALSCSVILAFSTDLVKRVSISLSPLSRAGPAASKSIVSNPAAAATWAIPAPICPAPITPMHFTVLI